MRSSSNPLREPLGLIIPGLIRKAMAEGARHINQGLSIDGGSGVFRMEEVSSDDYLENGIGIMSRMKYLETGER